MKRLVLHIYIMFMALTAMACPSNEVKLVQDWDKTFPKSEKVNHKKVKFKTQYGFTLAADLKNKTFTMAGGVVDPLPEDAPQFVKDYHAYYKTPRGYHKRSGNSNDGWRTTGCQAYANTRFLYYINEIRSAVLIVHGEKAHSRYFGESAFRYMMDGKAEGYDFVRKPNPVPNNKQLLIIPGASHCDLYDGGGKGLIPWDNIEDFLKKNLK
mgnify:FL=1